MGEVHSMRDKILEKMIELVAENGYENVSMREVAKAVGIKVSSIYNHYESKEDLLSSIYDYFEENYAGDYYQDEEIKAVVRTGSREEIIMYLNANYLFNEEKDGTAKYKNLVLITKIIIMRCFNDHRARHIFLEQISARSEKRLEEMLDYGISIGKFDEFDTKTFAKLMVGQYMFMGIKGFCDPNYSVGRLDEESDLEKLFINLLPLKD